MAAYLIDKGVGVNDYDNVGGWTPLYAAAFFGWPDVRRLCVYDDHPVTDSVVLSLF